MLMTWSKVVTFLHQLQRDSLTFRQLLSRHPAESGTGSFASLFSTHSTGGLKARKDPELIKSQEEETLEDFTTKVSQHKAPGLPIIHHDKYVCPFPVKHRFCMRKFHAVLRHLRTDGIISMKQVAAPSQITAKECGLVHCRDYIHRFFNGQTTQKEQKITGFEWSPGIVSRCRYETGGTLLACHFALERGLACSTGGGTHHAFADHGSGYCLINDMAISATAMVQNSPVERVLIFDLDVHQGDGTAAILQDNPSTFTVSVHCESNFPFIKQKSDLDLGLRNHVEDEEYLNEIEDLLPDVLDMFTPDLAIYDAGVDPHKDDALGKLDLTDEGLYRRDYYVLDYFVRQGIPVATVIGGGYHSNLSVLGRRHTIVHRAATQVWQDRGL